MQSHGARLFTDEIHIAIVLLLVRTMYQINSVGKSIQRPWRPQGIERGADFQLRESICLSAIRTKIT